MWVAYKSSPSTLRYIMHTEDIAAVLQDQKGMKKETWLISSIREQKRLSLLCWNTDTGTIGIPVDL